MKKSILLFAAISLVTVSCAKEQTRTCTCRDDVGRFMYSSSKITKDKEEIKKFEDKCGADGIRSTHQSSSGNTVTGTTVVVTPCELS
jgi:hypothetical protein